MDKEKEILTAEEFFSYKIEDEYSRQFHNKTIVNISVDKYKKWAHEYAVLFAKHIRKEMIEAIKEIPDSGLFLREEIDFIKDHIENAYKEDNIV